MSHEQLMQHFLHLETDYDDLQRQLAEAKDYIEHMEDRER